MRHASEPDRNTADEAPPDSPELRSEIRAALLTIVGSTVVWDPDLLPQRLSPLYAYPGDLEHYYEPADEEGPQAPVLTRVWRCLAEDFAANGDLILFTEELYRTYLPNHWMLQFTHNGPFEYIPADAAIPRLKKAGEDALIRCSEEISKEKREDAIQSAWYARRADPDSALPLLILIALYRDTAPDDVE